MEWLDYFTGENSKTGSRTRSIYPKLKLKVTIIKFKETVTLISSQL